MAARLLALSPTRSLIKSGDFTPRRTCLQLQHANTLSSNSAFQSRRIARASPRSRLCDWSKLKAELSRANDQIKILRVVKDYSQLSTIVRRHCVNQSQYRPKENNCLFLAISFWRMEFFAISRRLRRRSNSAKPSVLSAIFPDRPGLKATG